MRISFHSSYNKSWPHLDLVGDRLHRMLIFLMKENFTGPGVRLENYKLLIYLLRPSRVRGGLDKQGSRFHCCTACSVLLLNIEVQDDDDDRAASSIAIRSCAFSFLIEFGSVTAF